jgi:tetratricopeptide (TPR) repeat protein
MRKLREISRPAASRSTLRTLTVALALSAAAGSLLAQAEAIAEGDAAFARRAEGAKGARAVAGPINQAIAGYEKALKAKPGNLEASWKLLRALHFKGEYVATTSEAKQAAFGRGKQVVEAAIDELGKRAGGRAKFDAMAPAAAAKALAGVPEAPYVFLWGAVDWGLWGDAFGKLAAARQGVGDKVRRYGEIVLAIDPRFDEAGGHRLLGRLHTLAPKVPFITGWVDRDLAIDHLKKAVAIAPQNPYNQLYLADALLQYRPAAKAEAVAILKRVAAQKPSAERPVEDAAPIAEAKVLLGKAGG